MDVAPDGGEGLWFAREHDYDAIVLDLMLPGLNGYAVCATLRKAGNWTPILMLTAKDGEGTRSRGSTPAPTTTSSSRSRSRCCWPGCGRCSRRVHGARRRPLVASATSCSTRRAQVAWRGDAGAR